MYIGLDSDLDIVVQVHFPVKCVILDMGGRAFVCFIVQMVLVEAFLRSKLVEFHNSSRTCMWLKTYTG